MNDVARHVVLTCRNEDLGAGDRIGAIRLRLSLGADHAKVRAAMRLCQVHRARPFSRDHLGQVHGLLLFTTCRLKRRSSAAGEAGIHRESLIGGANILFKRKAQHMRQALSAKLFGACQRGPTRFDELRISFLEAIGRRDRSIFMAGTALLIPDLVERCEHFRTELARLVHDRVDHVLSGVLEAGQIAVAGKVEHFIDDEARVARRCGVSWHHLIPIV